jgi:hypothetical protein
VVAGPGMTGRKGAGRLGWVRDGRAQACPRRARPPAWLGVGRGRRRRGRGRGPQSGGGRGTWCTGTGSPRSPARRVGRGPWPAARDRRPKRAQLWGVVPRAPTKGGAPPPAAPIPPSPAWKPIRGQTHAIHSPHATEFRRFPGIARRPGITGPQGPPPAAAPKPRGVRPCARRVEGRWLAAGMRAGPSYERGAAGQRPAAAVGLLTRPA